MRYPLDKRRNSQPIPTEELRPVPTTDELRRIQTPETLNNVDRQSLRDIFNFEKQAIGTKLTQTKEQTPIPAKLLTLLELSGRSYTTDIVKKQMHDHPEYELLLTRHFEHMLETENDITNLSTEEVMQLADLAEQYGYGQKVLLQIIEANRENHDIILHILKLAAKNKNSRLIIEKIEDIEQMIGNLRTRGDIQLAITNLLVKKDAKAEAAKRRAHIHVQREKAALQEKINRV